MVMSKGKVLILGKQFLHLKDYGSYLLIYEKKVINFQGITVKDNFITDCLLLVLWMQNEFVPKVQM